MTETVSPFHAYSDDRLLQARETVRARVALAERNLERVLAHQERAQAATVCGRQYLARAKGDERLIEAILKERETIFGDEKEGDVCKQEGDSGGKEEQQIEQGGLSYQPAAPPEAPRRPGSVSSPGSLRQRPFSRSAY